MCLVACHFSFHVSTSLFIPTLYSQAFSQSDSNNMILPEYETEHTTVVAEVMVKDSTILKDTRALPDETASRCWITSNDEEDVEDARQESYEKMHGSDYSIATNFFLVSFAKVSLRVMLSNFCHLLPPPSAAAQSSAPDSRQ